MTTVELELRKAEIARMILNESDEQVIGTLFAFLTQEQKTSLPLPRSDEAPAPFELSGRPSLQNRERNNFQLSLELLFLWYKIRR